MDVFIFKNGSQQNGQFENKQIKFKYVSEMFMNWMFRNNGNPGDSYIEYVGEVLTVFILCLQLYKTKWNI